MINNIELIELYKSGLDHKQIAEKLKNEYGQKISYDAIRKRITRYINTLKDKEKNELKDEHKKNSKKILFSRIEKLYREGHTSVEIGKEVGLEATTVNNYISFYFKDLKLEHVKNSKSELLIKISDLYRKGFTTIEIGNELGMNASTVKNYTSKLVESKEEHENNYKLRLDVNREFKKIFNQSSNREMSTRQAVIQNRQSYYTDKNGNLNFDITRGAIPIDLPKMVKAFQV